MRRVNAEPTPKLPEPPEDVFARLYACDMGRRTEDAETWAWALRAARREDRPVDVAEVGVGQGRVLRLARGKVLLGRWEGIDPSRAMLARLKRMAANQGGADIYPVHGRAELPSTWDPIRLRGPVDLVIIAYSTLFLVPHEDQEALLRNALCALRPGGLVVVEQFVPMFAHSDIYGATSEVTNPDPTSPERWGRHTRYHVDATQRRTRAVRTYGPLRDSGAVETVHRYEETIYWREPTSTRALLSSAGFAVGLDAPSAVGHVALVGRA